MGRIVRSHDVGRQRAQVCRAIVVALREMTRRAGADDQARDLTAFVVLALEEVGRSVETTATAWEKRDYWLKADQFRMQWAWSTRLAESLHHSLLQNDWASVARAMAQLATHLEDVTLPKRNTAGTPWAGAYERLVAGR